MELDDELNEGLEGIWSDADFLRRMEKERATVGHGMLSSRYQRFERRVTGKQFGPDSFDRNGQPTIHDPLGGNRDWQQEYSRFFPGNNEGKPTPRGELKKILANRSKQPHIRAYSQHTPRRISFALTSEARAMLADFGVESASNAMLRPAPNPVRDLLDPRTGRMSRASGRRALTARSAHSLEPRAKPKAEMDEEERNAAAKLISRRMTEMRRLAATHLAEQTRAQETARQATAPAAAPSPRVSIAAQRHAEAEERRRRKEAEEAAAAKKQAERFAERARAAAEAEEERRQAERERREAVVARRLKEAKELEERRQRRREEHAQAVAAYEAARVASEVEVKERVTTHLFAGKDVKREECDAKRAGVQKRLDEQDFEEKQRTRRIEAQRRAREREVAVQLQKQAELPLERHHKEHARQYAATDARQRYEEARLQAALSSRAETQARTERAVTDRENRHEDWIEEQHSKRREAWRRVQESAAERAAAEARIAANWNERQAKMKSEEESRRRSDEQLKQLKHDLDAKERRLKEAIYSSKVRSQDLEKSEIEAILGSESELKAR